MKTNSTVMKIAQTALFAALCYVIFTYLQIKIPMPGGDATSIHLGNAFCVLAALLLGGWYGGLAGAIGMGIADVMDPIYITGAPKTFILKLCIGLTPEQGMEFSENLIEDDDFRKKVAGCKADIENGMDIAEALVKAGIFTGVYARMTSIAGKAGMMDEVMGRIADECEEEVDEKLSSMIAVLEPTLVIILSVIVGTILLSVMLPLLGIMSGL